MGLPDEKNLTCVVDEKSTPFGGPIQPQGGTPKESFSGGTTS
jgi:hypothetical protein